MEQQLSWLVDDDILLVTLVGGAAIEEIDALASELIAILDQHSQKISIIFETSQVHSFPRELRRIGQIWKPYYQHPHLMWTTMVTSNTMHYYFASVASRISRGKWRNHRTIEESLHFIHAQNTYYKS